ncbi:MAG: phage terminase large subunit [Janthinobacterium lividum]
MPNPPIDLAALKAEFILRENIKNDLNAWCEHALAPFDQAPAAHHRVLIDRLQAVERGDIRRLIVNLPPGSAKSTYASIMFPAWYMARNPNTNIIGLSYGSDLAESFSSKLRVVVEENSPTLGYGIMANSRSRELWHTDNGCQYRCAGITGGVTGFRANLAIIDDPIRNWSDAFSPIIKATVWEEYEASVLTRLKPGGAIVIIQTRWAPDDLSGRLIEEQSGKWHVLRMPALCEDIDDPLGRNIGEALWPEYQTLGMMEDLRDTMSDLVWSGLYQQRPRPLEGNLFNVANMNSVRNLPSGITVTQTVRHWDLAGTAEAEGRKPDWTVGVKLSKLSNGAYIIEDVARMRGDPAAVEMFLISTATEDGRDVHIGLPQDPGAAGKSSYMYAARALAGYRVTAIPQSGNKIQRAMPASSQVNAGNIMLREGKWNSTFIEELASFPGGKHDDQVDAFASAFNATIVQRQKARMFNTSLTSR